MLTLNNMSTKGMLLDKTDFDINGVSRKDAEAAGFRYYLLGRKD